MIFSKGELVALWLEQEAARHRLSEWCKERGLSEEDYDVFMKAGIDAVNKRHENLGGKENGK